MKPVTKALNILQSEMNTHMGWLQPVIFQLEQNSDDWKYPATCADQGDPELIAAAIFLPKFKTTWTEKANVTDAGMIFITYYYYY